MWTVIYIAVNRTQAEMLKDLLLKESILAQIRPIGIANLGEGMYELMVLESEASDAQTILCDYVVK